MKAVILAGGRGSRLAPLTDTRPKPLMPVAGRPLLTYLLEWMTTLPITDVYLTLGYLGEQIVEQLGSRYGRLRLHHVVEAQPLGTAGSVAALSRVLDETTLVVSGDLLVDLDVSLLMDLHQRHHAWVSLVLTRTADPSPYGAVLAERDGRLVGFLEKPAPDQHLTDRVNAGIYLLEPSALTVVPSGVPYDFSRELFPQLLRAGRPIVAAACPGYWRDIGSLESYRQANLDVLARRLRWRPGEPEVRPGLFAAEGIDEPAPGSKGYVAAKCHLAPDSLLVDSVLGEACALGTGSRVQRSVLGDRVHVASGADVADAVVVAGTRVGPGQHRGLVPMCLGQAMLAGGVEQEAPPGPGLRVLAGSGAPGDVGAVAGGLAVAFPGETLVIGGDSGPAALLVKDALGVALRSRGVQVVDAGACIWPATRFALGKWKCGAGLHVLSDGETWQVVLLTPVGRPAGWSLPAPASGGPGGPVGAITSRQQTEWLYLENLLEMPEAAILRTAAPELRVLGLEAWPTLTRWAHRLGVRVVDGGALALGLNPDEDSTTLPRDEGGIVQIALLPLAGGWRLHCAQRGLLSWPDQVALETILSARAEQSSGRGTVAVPSHLGLLTRRHLAQLGWDIRPAARLRCMPSDPVTSLARLLSWFATDHEAVVKVDAMLPTRAAVSARVALPVARRATALGALLSDWPGAVEPHPDGRGVHLSLGVAVATLWFEAVGDDLHLWAEAPEQEEAEALLARVELRLAAVAGESIA